MLSNVNHPPEVGSFLTRDRNVRKTEIVVDYNSHIGSVELGYRISHLYTLNRRTRKWANRPLFHDFSIAVLKAYFVNSLGHQSICTCVTDWWLNCVSWGKPLYPLPNLQGRGSTSVYNQSRNLSQHIPDSRPVSRRCRVCYQEGRRRQVRTYCSRCDLHLSLCDYYRRYYRQA